MRKHIKLSQYELILIETALRFYSRDTEGQLVSEHGLYLLDLFSKSDKVILTINKDRL